MNCNGEGRLLLKPLWLGKERVFSFFEGALLLGIRISSFCILSFIFRNNTLFTFICAFLSTPIFFKLRIFRFATMSLMFVNLWFLILIFDKHDSIRRALEFEIIEPTSLRGHSVSYFINLNSIKFEYTSSSEMDHDSYFLEKIVFLKALVCWRDLQSFKERGQKTILNHAAAKAYES